KQFVGIDGVGDERENVPVDLEPSVREQLYEEFVTVMLQHRHQSTSAIRTRSNRSNDCAVAALARVPETDIVGTRLHCVLRGLFTWVDPGSPKRNCHEFVKLDKKL